LLFFSLSLVYKLSDGRAFCTYSHPKSFHCVWYTVDVQHVFAEWVKCFNLYCVQIKLKIKLTE
jgi:hypothetical protein